MKIEIEPQFEIGKEFYILSRNEIKTGLIAEYKVYVTSYTDNTRGWLDQLFDRFYRGKHKDEYKMSFEYTAKIEHDIYAHSLSETKDGWYVNGSKVYFSKEELVKTLIK